MRGFWYKSQLLTICPNFIYFHQTCCVLHNFLNQGGSDFEFTDFEGDPTLQDDTTHNQDIAIPTAAGTKKMDDVVASAKQFREEGGKY